MTPVFCSLIEQLKPGRTMIYFIQAEGIGHIKIGFTDNDDALIRLASLQIGSPVKLRLLGTILGTADDEKDLHRRFAAYRIHGEWFDPVPELLMMIGACGSAPQACSSIEIVPRSVSIRTLTVGRKQFTKRILEQLPIQMVFNWKRAAHEDAETEGGLLGIPAERFVVGNMWGWVVGNEGMWLVGEPWERTAHKPRWIIFECYGRLYRAVDYVNFDALCEYEGITPTVGLRCLNTLRMQLPGFLQRDQLFIGV